MSYGIDFTNNNGHTVISEATYNLGFVGKAAYRSRVDSAPSYVQHYKDLYRTMYQYKFRTTTPTRPTPFVYVPRGNRFSITGIQQIDAVTWDITVDVWPDVMPEVYVFAPVTGQAPGAWGLAVYDANGQLVFNGDKKHLVVQQMAVVAGPSCVRQEIRENNIYFVARCSGESYTALAPTPAKAAIFAPSHGSAGTPNLNSQLNNNEYYSGTFYLNGDTLVADWVHAAQGGSPSDFTYSQGVRPVMVIDAAMYD